MPTPSTRHSPISATASPLEQIRPAQLLFRLDCARVVAARANFAKLPGATLGFAAKRLTIYELCMNSPDLQNPTRLAKFSAAIFFIAAPLLLAQPAAAQANQDELTPPITVEESQPHTPFDSNRKINIETPVETDGEQRDYSKQYNGSFVEYSLRGGASLSSNADYNGWNIDAGMRHSFPALLGDFRLAYRYDRLSPNSVASERRDAMGRLTASPLIQNHSVGGYLGIHPGYLLLLGNSRIAYALASLHAEIGVGAEYTIVDPAEAKGGDSRGQFGPFFSIGVGLNIPITSPDVGYAPWIHLLYRWHVSDFVGETEDFDVNMHILQIGLGWRINGLLF